MRFTRNSLPLLRRRESFARKIMWGLGKVKGSFLVLFLLAVYCNAGLRPTDSSLPMLNKDADGLNTNVCTVYLAPSSTKNGGMGFFTTKSIKEGMMIHPADSPAIPIIDPDRSQESLDAWVGLWSGYWWGSGSSDATMFEAEYAVDFQTGIGSFPNTHAFLDNLKIAFPKVVPIDDSILDREVNPGAGASSINLGRHAIANRDIDAGEEIFLRYPKAELNRISEQYNVPNQDDFVEAGKWLSNLLDMFHKKDIPWKKIVASDSSIFAPVTDRVNKILPKSKADLDQILKSSKNSIDPSELSLAIAKEMSVEKRSVEWIRKNGFCLDNMMIERSINPQAGKGAFAQRSMVKGEVIVPAPMLLIKDRDALRIPAFEGERMQLLVNYCFGHDDSSLLLCPYSNALLLNHCSDRRPNLHPCGINRGPNAEYRWSKEQNSSWLDKSLEELKQIKERIPLSLDIIATRDIEPGEELYIDYGQKWEEAWDQHLYNWSPIDEESPEPWKERLKWKSAKELNDALGPLREAPNFSEKFISMDDRGVLFTGCFYNPNDDSEERFWEHLHRDEESWEDMEVENIVSKFGTPANDVFAIEDSLDDINPSTPFSSYFDGSFWPCVVTEDEEGLSNDNEDGGYYTVRIVQSPHRDAASWERMDVPRIITSYPRSSIRHFYLQYESDLHLRNAFRRHVDLKDEIFPPQWKNRRW